MPPSATRRRDRYPRRRLTLPGSGIRTRFSGADRPCQTSSSAKAVLPSQHPECGQIVGYSAFRSWREVSDPLLTRSGSELVVKPEVDPKRSTGQKRNPPPSTERSGAHKDGAVESEGCAGRIDEVGPALGPHHIDELDLALALRIVRGVNVRPHVAQFESALHRSTGTHLSGGDLVSHHHGDDRTARPRTEHIDRLLVGHRDEVCAAPADTKRERR